MLVKKLLGPFFFGLIFFLGSNGALVFSREIKPSGPPTLSTHVLNTASGKPAMGLAVVLHRQVGKEWEELGRGVTDRQGRVAELGSAGKPLGAGIYKLVFETGDHFQSLGIKTFFPKVEIIFEIDKPKEHYHVPLLLSPFGYSTYRGS